jgi:Na+-translocating ferredoxin:NAD+ oxidoreductase RnfG subunit
MDSQIIAIVIQAGAVGLLAMVLWQVGQKIDTAMKNMQELLLKMLEIVAQAKVSAELAQIQATKNYEAIKRTDVHQK